MEIGLLQDKIMQEEAMQLEKAKELEELWQNERPYSGEMLPQEALNLLQKISSRLSVLKDQYEKTCKAKELLNLEVRNADRLENLYDEVSNLTEVW